MPPLLLPLNARIETTDIVAEKSSIFRSSLQPFLIYSDGSTYPVIFKDGDDTRQGPARYSLMDPLVFRLHSSTPLSLG